MVQVKLGSQACTGRRRLGTSGSSTEKRSCYKRRASTQVSESMRGKDELLEVKLWGKAVKHLKRTSTWQVPTRGSECKGKQEPTPSSGDI